MKQHIIPTQYNNIFDVVSELPPHKRTIRFNSALHEIEFDYHLMMFTKVIAFEDACIRIGNSYVFGSKEPFSKNGIVSPFDYPHVGPTNGAFCYYIAGKHATLDACVKNELDGFLCSNNEFYMHDNFGVNKSRLRMSSPKLKTDIEYEINKVLNKNISEVEFLLLIKSALCFGTIKMAFNIIENNLTDNYVLEHNDNWAGILYTLQTQDSFKELITLMLKKYGFSNVKKLINYYVCSSVIRINTKSSQYNVLYLIDENLLKVNTNLMLNSIYYYNYDFYDAPNKLNHTTLSKIIDNFNPEDISEIEQVIRYTKDTLRDYNEICARFERKLKKLQANKKNMSKVYK